MWFGAKYPYVHDIDTLPKGIQNYCNDTAKFGPKPFKETVSNWLFGNPFSTFSKTYPVDKKYGSYVNMSSRRLSVPKGGEGGRMKDIKSSTTFG